MNAIVGDHIVIRGHQVGQGERRGEIVEVHGAQGAPPYMVRWSDGHEGLFFPGSDAIVEHVAEGRPQPAA